MYGLATIPIHALQTDDRQTMTDDIIPKTRLLQTERRMIDDTL